MRSCVYYLPPPPSLRLYMGLTSHATSSTSPRDRVTARPSSVHTDNVGRPLSGTSRSDYQSPLAAAAAPSGKGGRQRPSSVPSGGRARPSSALVRDPILKAAAVPVSLPKQVSFGIMGGPDHSPAPPLPPPAPKPSPRHSSTYSPSRLGSSPSTPVSPLFPSPFASSPHRVPYHIQPASTNDDDYADDDFIDPAL